MKNFGLSETKTNRKRRKRPFKNSDSLSYYVRFEPYNLVKKDERINAIRSFKHPITECETKTAIEMIDRTLDLVEQKEDLSEFGAVLPMASSSYVMQLMLERIEKRPNWPKIYRDAFAKNLMSDVQVRHDILANECEQSQIDVPKYIENAKRAHFNSPAKISYFSSSRRRYVKNLIRLNDALPTNKRVIVIDDTVGELATFYNAHEVLKQIGIENELYVAIMKDFCIKYNESFKENSLTCTK